MYKIRLNIERGWLVGRKIERVGEWEAYGDLDVKGAPFKNEQGETKLLFEDEVQELR